ncbi:MAG: radical SAM family heme chaperone HemW [Bdellovibrionaceae bacterium]|nr:radical SAM family heme chaperone HemW [Bdellovibrio sp.]
MSVLGVYIHIPYCLQRCTYCDFATYVHTEIRPPQEYVALVKKEISDKKNLFRPQELKTIYFGGGTPSLISAELIVDLISELAKFGYTTGPQTEITIEINPATVDERKLEIYLKAGINRFSVGAQSFSDRLLKMVHREHNADQTKQTLTLLRKYKLNFSFDLLFALPTQTLNELRHDVEVAVELGSKHISPYCLTVPEGHPLSKNRPLEEEQIEMFQIIHDALTRHGQSRYEISNYAVPGFESQHNLLYWTDHEYWGLGLSAHSYSKDSPWGSRFWNPNSLDIYARQALSGAAQLSSQVEVLEKHQALTDFCHTSLRLSEGLSVDKLVQKFGSETSNQVKDLTQALIQHQLLTFQDQSYRLTEKGILISNQIFEKFTFLKSDLA